jgi:hypothetical protein
VRHVAGRARDRGRGEGAEAGGADPPVRSSAGGTGSPGDGAHQEGPGRSPGRTPRWGLADS